jgi:hypothetical protein
VSSKMYIVDVRPEAPWASGPAYVRAGTRPSAIRVYMDSLTGIGDEGDLSEADIACVRFDECPVRHSTMVSELLGYPLPANWPGSELLAVEFYSLSVTP